MRPYERLLKCREEIRKRTDFRPQVGIVLGSGLGGYADNMEISCEYIDGSGNYQLRKTVYLAQIMTKYKKYWQRLTLR